MVGKGRGGVHGSELLLVVGTSRKPSQAKSSQAEVCRAERGAQYVASSCVFLLRLVFPFGYCCHNGTLSFKENFGKRERDKTVNKTHTHTHRGKTVEITVEEKHEEHG